MSEGDIELRNRRSRIKCGWDDAGSVVKSDYLLKDLISTKFLVKFRLWYTKGFNVVLVPTAVLVGGLAIEKDKPLTYIVYKVGPDRGY